ncbi:MAG: hypothetical protein NZ610_00810 [Candidatus Bipolaricaulota bacterium]|nr:hypothetical protein [Candidatus Bipolaricaulota bacterium]MCS7273937.1 hypothetical protein [Candidatus Bipolaricaulota bacterium]MDW8110432.1 hypothetical protein [Candidatus Bipolaricaulota bacterium]MDW8329926.1 hypothetical protein [Candidatus Bipolaricaulota bacterium]
MNLSRSRDDKLFGPIFAELEGLLARRLAVGSHPPAEVLSAYLESTLEEELVSVVSLHLLGCAECQQRVWRERLRSSRRRRWLRDRWSVWRRDHRATLAYATLGVVLGLFLVILGGLTWTGSFLVSLPAAGGGGGYPPPRPL